MNYRNLIKDLKTIVNSGLTDRKEDQNLTTTYTNWELGKRLVIIEQDGKERASYGKQILIRVAEDLKKHFGRGFGLANLKNMRKFYQLYQKADIVSQLAWSHYLSLIRVPDINSRKRLEKMTIRKNWSPRELSLQIRSLNSDYVETNKLERPTGVLNTLQIRKTTFGDREFSYLDMGFSIWLDLAQDDVKHFENKSLVTASGILTGLNIETYTGTRTDLWLYKARLDHVVDGDTIAVVIECGLDINSRQILRLQSVNAAPINEPAGIKARDFLVAQLKQASYLLIKTRQKDKYARYVADVFIGNDGESVSEILKNGLFLNQALLDEDLAVLNR